MEKEQNGTSIKVFFTADTHFTHPSTLYFHPERRKAAGITLEELQEDKMKAMLSERLSDEKVADWFSPRWRVFNECSIISYDEKTGKVTGRRPDRVITDGETTTVIDFKFGSQRQEYLDQMRQYMDLLDGMGMKNVSGYIWFVYTNKIIKVGKDNQ